VGRGVKKGNVFSNCNKIIAEIGCTLKEVNSSIKKIEE
jgi:hypothetical protein